MENSVVDKFNGMVVDDNGIRVHKHIILTAAVDNPPSTEQEVILWLKNLVHAIDMNILLGPYACTSDVPNNEGITGTVIIDTSHIALHLWNNVSPAIIELDIFSCKDYDVSVPIEFLRMFGLKAINFRCVDRTKAFEDLKLYVVYETTNVINNKTYIGVHTCYNFNYSHIKGDDRKLKDDYKKYGDTAFVHKVLYVYTKEEEARIKEAELVNEEYVQNSNTYNTKVKYYNNRLNYEVKAKKRWLHKDGKAIMVEVSDIPRYLMLGWLLGKK